MLKTIGTFRVMLERKKYCAPCNVQNDWTYETWLKDLICFVEIRVIALIFRRGVGPKTNTGSLCRIKMKEIMRMYLL